jgi:hypothetical protein
MKHDFLNGLIGRVLVGILISALINRLWRKGERE